jgi:hypothetical protein
MDQGEIVTLSVSLELFPANSEAGRSWLHSSLPQVKYRGKCPAFTQIRGATKEKREDL